MSNRRIAIYIFAIVTLLLGLFTGRALFFSIAYLFGALILFSYIWARLAVRGIVVRRATFNRRTQVGKTFREQFIVRNTSIIPKLWLEIRDHSTLPNHKASNVVASIRPRASAEWRIDTPCVQRGDYRLGPVSIIAGDPFGFFLLPREVDYTKRVVVYPETFPISSFATPKAMLSGGAPERQKSHNVTTNAAGVREYVRGDSINRIHWRSTARRGKLIVKEFEIDPLENLWALVDFSQNSLVVDISQNGGNDLYPNSTEEYVVKTAASIVQHFIERERSIGFTAYLPHREFLQTERGNRQLTRILELLAVARSRSEKSLADILALELSHIPRGTTIIAITSTIDESWIRQAQLLPQRGYRTMCVYIKPESFNPVIQSNTFRDQLQIARIPTIVVENGDNIGQVLSQPPVV